MIPKSLIQYVDFDLLEGIIVEVFDINSGDLVEIIPIRNSEIKIKRINNQQFSGEMQ